MCALCQELPENFASDVLCMQPGDVVLSADFLTMAEYSKISVGYL